MKKILTKEEQINIGRHICNKGRDIDVAIFNYLDGSMPNDFILDALMLYMTKDGGFAGGLYIDNYNPNSSVYQIYEALRIMDMTEIDPNTDHEMFPVIINRSLNYIYNRAELKENRWNPNVITNNDFAHSQEFEYTEENRLMFGYAPTAAILGYTLEFCPQTKAYYKKALKMIPIMLKDLYEAESLSKYEFISFNIFLNTIRKLNLFENEQKKIEEKLTILAKKAVSIDFSNPKNILPLDCADALSDPELKEKIELQLDYILSSIAKHGLWEYEGDWGYNRYAEEDSAKIKWIGAKSVQNYFLLKKYGRLE